MGLLFFPLSHMRAMLCDLIMIIILFVFQICASKFYLHLDIPSCYRPRGKKKISSTWPQFTEMRNKLINHRIR